MISNNMNMSDDENDLIEGGEGEEDEDEWKILQLRCLIQSVKQCPALYATNKKEYCGKNFDKELAWQTIGLAQVTSIKGRPMSFLCNAVNRDFAFIGYDHTLNVSRRSCKTRVLQGSAKVPQRTSKSSSRTCVRASSPKPCPLQMAPVRWLQIPSRAYKA